MGEWRGRRRGRGGGGKGGGRCYNRGTASTAASWFYPQTDKIWIPSHCRSLDRRGQSCTLGNPAGSHPSDTDGRMSQAATPPCLGPHLRVPNPGLPAVPTAHRPPPGLGQPLSCSLRRLGQAALRRCPAGRWPPSRRPHHAPPSLRPQTHCPGNLDIQGRLIVQCSMVAPDSGWGISGARGGRESSGCQPLTPGGDPHTLCWVAVFLAGLGPRIPIASWAVC